MVALDEAAALGFVQLAQHRCQRQPRPFLEQAQGDAEVVAEGPVVEVARAAGAARRDEGGKMKDDPLDSLLAAQESGRCGLFSASTRRRNSLSHRKFSF